MTRRRLATLASATALLATSAPATAMWRPGSLPSLGAAPARTHLIQPGMQISTPTGTCTTNFVFQDGDSTFNPDQTLYIGTAGHCGSVGDTVEVPAFSTFGVGALPYELGTIVHDDDGTADFALIRIKDSLRGWVSPSVRHLGGPVGTYDGPAGGVVGFSGYGRAVGTGGTPRYGVLHTLSTTYGGAYIVTAFGDSGGPFVASDGRAVGLLHGSYTVGEVGIGADAQIPTVQSAVASSGKVLVTCKIATPWYLPGCPPAP